MVDSENLDILISDISKMKHNIKYLEKLKEDFILCRDKSEGEMKRVYRKCVNKLEKAENACKDVYYELNVLYHI